MSTRTWWSRLAQLIKRRRRRRALRRAARALALVSDVLKDKHLPRSTRRRFMAMVARGQIDAAAFMSEEAGL